MALPILDGNQSATTLSSILTGGEHIPAHTVVSLGTQAITDIRGAVSGSVVSISNFPATQTIAGTVTANIDNVSANLTGVDTPRPQQGIALGYLTDSKQFFASVDEDNGLPVRIAGDSQTQSIFGTVTVGNSVTIASLPLIAGTVTANLGNAFINTSGGYQPVQFSTGLPVANERDGITFDAIPFLVAGSVTIGSALPAGTNRIGVVTIGGGTVTIGAGTAQIGSVTASISGTVPVSISSVTVGNSVTIASLPLIAGTVTANLNDDSNVIASQVETGIENYAQDLANTPLPISGTVTIGNSVTIASFATSVTARLINPAGTAVTYAEVGTAGSPSIDVISVQGVTSGTAIAISGTVTANSSNGSLTTRFGSVTTANTAFATSAVTNASRKYLLIQNVTTASNVITVGIGFTPTTTQGIQLSSGAGLTFEGSYIPTGAVNLLSSVTASCFTILEA